MDKRKQYEIYKLQWLIDHGYSLEDVIEAVEVTMEQIPSLNKLTEAFIIWETEVGFNSEIYASYDEFLVNEGV